MVPFISASAVAFHILVVASVNDSLPWSVPSAASDAPPVEGDAPLSAVDSPLAAGESSLAGTDAPPTEANIMLLPEKLVLLLRQLRHAHSQGALLLLGSQPLHNP